MTKEAAAHDVDVAHVQGRLVWLLLEVVVMVLQQLRQHVCRREAITQLDLRCSVHISVTDTCSARCQRLAALRHSTAPDAGEHPWGGQGRIVARARAYVVDAAIRTHPGSARCSWRWAG